MSLSKNGRGCWTCKQRKVACDRGRPRCEVCNNTGRRCLGYGLKLSWPRKGDRKRTIVLKSNAQFLYSSVLGEFVRVSNADIELHENRAPRKTEFINVSMFDLAMYEDLSNAASLAMILHDNAQTTSIRPNPRWAAFPYKATEIDLFSYYQDKVSPRLTAANSAAIRSLLFKMSFTDTQPGSTGVLFAIYAIASLHLADTVSANMYKSKAITSILASTSQSPHPSLSLQQIMVFTLLALFETAAHVHPLIEWEHDICCLRMTGISTFALDRMYEGDESLVLENAIYHDFLTQFSIRHNCRRTKLMVEKVRTKHLAGVALNSPHRTFIRPVLGCSLDVFCAIFSILEASWDAEKEGYDPENEVLDKLERRLKYSKQELDGPHSLGQSSEDLAHITSIAELHRLCGLIYIYRVGRGVASNHPTLRSLVSDAFSILETVRTCDRTFPLFLLGCEAETDVQRALILRITRRTEEEYFSNVMIRIREYVERFWALTDLDTVGEVSHTERMTAAASAQSSLPSFL